MDMSSSICVAVRVRPFTIREAAQIQKVEDGPQFFGDGSLAAAPVQKITGKGIRSVIKVIDDRMLVFDPPEDNPMARFQKTLLPQGKRVKDMRFGFDRVFDESVTQEEVYECTTRGLLDSVLDGYNATVFAYGATGCGKTHTISGTPQQPGIIFLTCRELFEKIEAMKETKEVELTLSYLEIYNETIRDLLVEGGCSKPLALREDSNQAISVAGLSTHIPKNVYEVMDIIMLGNANRTMSPTDANATSSRSHAVLQINVTQKDRVSGLSQNHTMATLSIIDLAGSERASVTKNRGERLLEGANINRSLLALGNCINALCDPTRRNHVPYRDSKLTRLLKFSLGGNCKTVMIVCVSPSSQHYDETHNTLKYANRAKNIKTKATRNTMNVNRHVSQYVKAIYDLKQEVEELKKRLGDTTKEAMDKLTKQQTARDVMIKESSRRIKAAYENSLDMRNTRIQDYKNMRLIERRIALVMSWTTAFDSVFAGKGDETPKALLAVRSEAERVLQELQQNKFSLQHRLQGPSAEREIDRALDMALKHLRAMEGVTDVDIATITCEANLYKSLVERDFYQNLASVDAESATSVIILSKAHFETVACLNQLNMYEDSVSDAARKSLQDIMRLCTEATSQMIKPNGELTFLINSSDGFKIPRLANLSAMDSPRKKKVLQGIDMASPIRGPFAQQPVLGNVTSGMTNAAVAASPMVRPSPRAFKVGTPTKKAVIRAKKSPGKKVKRVRWYDETIDAEAEDVKNVWDLEENKRPGTENVQQLRASVPHPPPPTFGHHQQATESTRHPTTSASLPSISAGTSLSPIPEAHVSNMTITATSTRDNYHLDHAPIRPRNNRMEMGFLSKKSETSSYSSVTPSPGLSNSSSSSLAHSHPTTNLKTRKSDLPLKEADSSTLNLRTEHTSHSDDERPTTSSSSAVKSWRATTAAARARRVSSGSISNPHAPRPRPRRTHHVVSSPEHVVFKAGHARRMLPGAREKENAGAQAAATVLSPKSSTNLFKNSARRSTISGRGDLMQAVARRVSSIGMSGMSGILPGLSVGTGMTGPVRNHGGRDAPTASKPVPWR